MQTPTHQRTWSWLGLGGSTKAGIPMMSHFPPLLPSHFMRPTARICQGPSRLQTDQGSHKSTQGLGSSLMEVALAQRDRTLGFGSEVNLGLRPEARGKGTWGGAGLGLGPRSELITFILVTVMIIIMKNLIIIIKTYVHVSEIRFYMPTFI